QYSSGLPSTRQWNGGIQMMLPWATALDVEYTGQHAYNIVEAVNLNAVDFGSAYAGANQDPTLSSGTPGAAAVQADQMRAFRGYSTILLYQKGSTNARLQHNADGTYSERPDQAQADDLFGNFVPTRHTFKGNFVWALPHFDGSSTATRALSQIARDWQLSGVWTANTGTAYTVGVSYQG